jgi:hypothetical protein
MAETAARYASWEKTEASKSASTDCANTLLRSVSQDRGGIYAAEHQAAFQLPKNSKLPDSLPSLHGAVEGLRATDAPKSQARKDLPDAKVRDGQDQSQGGQKQTHSREIRDFEARTGVEVRERDGKYEYHLQINGKDNTLYKPGVNLSLKEAEQSLVQAVHDKEKLLQNKYHVDFSKNTESISSKWLSWNKCREPNYREIIGIEEVLKNNPSTDNNVAGGIGVKFFFPRKYESTGGSSSEKALAYHHKIDDRSSIVIEPGTSNAPITDADTYKQWKEGKGNKESFASIVRHELAHHGQNQIGNDTGENAKENRIERMGRRIQEYIDPMNARVLSRTSLDSHKKATRFEEDKEFGEMGWKRTGVASENWALAGKDGHYYRHNGGSFSGTWSRCDREGNVIAEAGKAKTLNNDQMKDNAIVTPCSNYFPKPWEMQAEALSQFRGGQAYRGYLASKNPALYEAAKQADQYTINLGNGVRENKEPVCIRNFQGEIVPNTPENSAQVQLTEKWYKDHRIK